MSFPFRDALQFFGARRSRMLSFHEQLEVLLVTGGIPRHLQEIDPRQPAEGNLQRLCFEQGGALFLEYDRLMRDLFPRNNQAVRDILEAVADAPLTLEELADALGIKPSRVLSRDVEQLEKAGFLMRHHTWNPHTRQPSNRYKIRLIDNYVRFYLKAIQPAAAQVRSGQIRSRPGRLPPNLHSLLSLQFQNLVYKNRTPLLPAMGVDPAQLVREGPYFQDKNARHPGCQIDYLVQTRYSLYVVEIRFSVDPLPVDVVREVRTQVEALGTLRNLSARPILVHVNGVADSVREQDYFDKIIDFGALVAQRLPA